MGEAFVGNMSVATSLARDASSDGTAMGCFEADNMLVGSPAYKAVYVSPDIVTAAQAGSPRSILLLLLRAVWLPEQQYQR